MGERELVRRVLHVVPGLLPLLFLVRWRRGAGMSEALQVAVVALVLAVAGVALGMGGKATREGERSLAPSVVGYMLPVLVLVIAAPNRPSLVVSVLAVVAFGDGTATIVGTLVGGPVLPWNGKKTWAGSLAFILLATPVTTYFYWRAAAPGVTVGMALARAALASGVGAAFESLDSRVNDNLRVGVAVGVAVTACWWVTGV